MTQWATEADQKYRVALKLEAVGPFFTAAILEKWDRDGNTEADVLYDTNIIQERNSSAA